MVIKPEELKKEIEKRLKKYEENEIEISGKNYLVYIPKEDKDYIFEKDEDINLFEGILFAELDKKAELSDLLGYKPPLSGYVGRIGIIIYRNEELIIKDYRANKQIRKTIAKINSPFIKKLRKALEEPKSENISALFSRSDVIEEFYVLYKKCREFLLRNVTGISEEEKREEFVDNFMMQMLTLWYLQEKGFFNKDRRYFITKFNELKQKKLEGGFDSYYGFLRHFFRQISGYSDEPYADDPEIGKCVVIGPAVFLNGEDDPAIAIPDKCFYQEGVTERLINLTPKGRRRMISEKDIDFDVPLLNLFESRDWVDGDIDEYVLGSIYEKLITYMERKKLGAFYTPEGITSYICKNTIEPYLVDRINEEFGKKYGGIDDLINTGEKEELIKLFELLKDIKILDPAVGSAHFLESAINVLVEIYKKLREKAREVGIESLEILVANEEGKIEPLNLLDIPEREGLFEVYVKFFIILSRNIYGVDINPSALKVARARLFLTLARHFNVSSGVFIRFPNVHFNLREGNSLIGYVDVPKGRGTKQVTLDFKFEDEEIEYIQDRIKVDDELKDYLPAIAKALRIEGDVVKEVKEMNRILALRRIKWGDFEKVLKTKEKLIQVLVASLNSRYAVKLNELLREITELFNRKLDEKFAEEHGIDLEDLKKIKTFHWIFEFPEVFLEKGGFDVVVGNPPYIRIQILREENPDLVECLSVLFTSATGNYDIYAPFVERGLEVINSKGILSYILPKKFFNASYGQGLRNLIRQKQCLKEAIDFTYNQVFVGVTNYTCILTLGFFGNDTFRYTIINDFSNPQTVISKILRNREIRDTKIISTFLPIELLNRDPWNFSTMEEIEVLDTLRKVGIRLEDVCERIFQGLRTSADSVYVFTGFDVTDKYFAVFSEETGKNYELEKDLLKPLVKGKNIKRFQIRKPEKLILFPYGKTDTGEINLIPPDIFEKRYPRIWAYLNECRERLENRENGRMKNERWYGYVYPKNLELMDHQKIITPDVAYRPTFAYDVLGIFYFTSGYGIIPKKEHFPKYILLLLNSKLSEFFLRKHSTEFRGGYRSFEFRFIKDVPIYQTTFEVQQRCCIIADYLLLLNQCHYDFYESVGDNNEEILNLMDQIEFISDTLVYELYFKQKFIEDSKKAIEEGKEPIYPQLEKGPFLIDLVAKYLKPIDYDSYAKLAYSIKSLSEEEKQKMEKMKEEYFKTIKDVVETIKADKEIMNLIERIKNHEWVKMIEGAEN